MGRYNNVPGRPFPSLARKRSSKSRSARLRHKIEHELKLARCAALILREHNYHKIKNIVSNFHVVQSASSNQGGNSYITDIPRQKNTNVGANTGTSLFSSSSPTESNIILKNIENRDISCKTPEKLPSPATTKIIEEQPTPNTEISFISEKEYDSIMRHELDVEKENSTRKKCTLSGNRVVDLQYVLNWSITLQYDHSKKCTSGKIYLIEETRWGTGFTSCLLFGCTVCNEQYKFYTEDPTKKSKINYGFVWGTLSTGSTYSHSEELFCAMDIPPMTLYVFKKTEAELGEVWKDALIRNMEKAGKEELQIAKTKGDVDQDGIPFITVFLDGGWSKRSYGHSYDAASGVAVIIGRATKKLLFLGVRNKYCSICARAANRKMPPNSHICYRNWSGSSSAMEADIIVEGFSKSVEMHGLRYKRFIADGDSSVYAKIRERVDYGQSVQKLECTNHALKNYGKALRKIKDDTKINFGARSLLTAKKIQELEKRAQSAIYDNAHGEVECLKEDLGNSPHHVFSDHTKCKAYYCSEEKNNIKSQIQQVKVTGLLLHINGALDCLIKKSHKLIDNETNNRAELFMAILARFNAGKRLNLIQRGSFQSRAELSGLRYNEGTDWHYSPWKSFTDESPGAVFKKFMENQKISRDLKNARRNITQEKNDKKKEHLPNVDYGPKARQAELSSEEMESERKRILARMQVSEEDRIQMPLQTIGQFDNELFINVRQNRLTASNFGAVVKRLDHTSCHSLVKSILYGNVAYSAAMEYGKAREAMVRAKFAEEYEMTISECGIFIDKLRGYLGASPDGLVGSNALIEIKCLYRVAQEGITLKTAIEKYKNLCLTVDAENNIKLKLNHNYYYQVQGQLNIAEREVCYFVVYSGENNPLHVEKIHRNTKHWEEVMVPKLEKFYLNCILPEMIRKNVTRGEKCVDPQYILDAQTKRNHNRPTKVTSV